MFKSLMSSMPACIALLAFSGPAYSIETGPDDFRITHVGPAGDTAFFASRPKIAYNSADDEFMTISISAGGPGLDPSEIELWSQRVGPDASILGTRTRVTEVGGINLINEFPRRHQVVYNSEGNEYLLVWQTTDPVFGDTAPVVYARRMDKLGQPIGSAIAVSEVTTGVGAFWPHVAYNATENEYIIVWTDNESGGFRITAQTMNATTLAVINDDYIAMVGDVFADRPSVAWDSVNNQYLLVWTNGVALSGQILAADGSPELVSDFAISGSNQGTKGISIGFNPDDEEYLVVWSDSVASIGSVAGNNEIFSRRVSKSGTALGSGPGRVSYSSGAGALGFGANIDNGGDTVEPGVAYNMVRKAFVVSWDSTVFQNNVHQREAHVRIIAGGTDAEPLSTQKQISNMGGPLDAGTYDGLHAVIATRGNLRYLMSVWWGDDNRSGGVDNEFELYGQLLDTNILQKDGFEE